MSTDYFDIVLDYDEDQPLVQFVEIEDPNGMSISVGEHIQREDGYQVIRIKQDSRITELEAALKEITTNAPLEEPSEGDYDPTNSGDMHNYGSDVAHYYYAKIARKALKGTSPKSQPPL